MQPQKQEEARGLAAHHSSPEAALYDRYAHSIFAYLRLHVTSREDAEDLTLEVFTAAVEHNNLVDLLEKEQLTWLRKVAHHKLVDAYRRANRHPAITLERVAETIYDDERRSPEQTALRHEEYQQLYSTISTLPVLQQQILQLRFGHSLRFADIAILLDKREAAVRQLLSRTLTLLRTIYNQQP